MRKVVLFRRGESVWNQENRFTGRTDVPLCEKEIEEAREAGHLLHEEGYAFDVAYTSFLKLAIKALWTVPEEVDLRPSDRMTDPQRASLSMPGTDMEVRTQQGKSSQMNHGRESNPYYRHPNHGDPGTRPLGAARGRCSWAAALSEASRPSYNNACGVTIPMAATSSGCLHHNETDRSNAGFDRATDHDRTAPEQ